MQFDLELFISYPVDPHRLGPFDFLNESVHLNGQLLRHLGLWDWQPEILVQINITLQLQDLFNLEPGVADSLFIFRNLAVVSEALFVGVLVDNVRQLVQNILEHLVLTLQGIQKTIPVLFWIVDGVDVVGLGGRYDFLQNTESLLNVFVQIDFEDKRHVLVDKSVDAITIFKFHEFSWLLGQVTNKEQIFFKGAWVPRWTPTRRYCLDVLLIVLLRLVVFSVIQEAVAGKTTHQANCCNVIQ